MKIQLDIYKRNIIDQVQSSSCSSKNTDIRSSNTQLTNTTVATNQSVFLERKTVVDYEKELKQNIQSLHNLEKSIKEMKENQNNLNQNNLQKIQAQWTIMIKSLCNCRGIWHNPEDVEYNTLYKFDKVECLNRRKFYLKRDKNAHLKPYKRKASNHHQEETKPTPIDEEEDIEAFSRQDLQKIDSYFLEEQTREQIIKKTFEAEYITQKGAIYGKFTISNEQILFESNPDKERPKQRKYLLGSTVLLKTKKKKQWQIREIREVHSRRFSLEEKAIEFRSTENKFYFFSFYDCKVQNQIFKFLREHVQIPLLRLVQNRKAEFHKQKFQKKWE